MSEFDLEGWVIRVLVDAPVEIYNPSAQAFWFYIHEAYAMDVAFVGQLIDERHDWIAMMCATEVQNAVPGMKPLLMRLTESDEDDVAAGASHHLAAFYADA